MAMVPTALLYLSTRVTMRKWILYALVVWQGVVAVQDALRVDAVRASAPPTLVKITKLQAYLRIHPLRVKARESQKGHLRPVTIQLQGKGRRG